MVLESKIDQFISKIELGVTFFEDAANLLVKMIDEDPHVHEQILKQRGVDWLSRDVLDTFEAIGRKRLAVQAIFLPKHVLDRIVGLPIADQMLIANEPIEVYSGTSGGRHKTDMKPARKLTRREAKAAIGPKGLRPINEQIKVANQDQSESLGFFEITTMNGKAFLKKISPRPFCQQVMADKNGRLTIEIKRKNQP